MKYYAKGNHKLSDMNKTEAAFAADLEVRKIAGDIIWYKYEGLKFRLADNTSYTPDFVVMDKDCQIILYEVKGYWLSGARAKIKIAADLYPFRFIAVMPKKKKDGGGWEYEEF